MATKQLPTQLIRYAIVGLTSNGIAFCVYLTITWLGVAPEATAAGLYLAGAISSYYGNYQWTFSSERSHFSTLPRFVIAHALGFSIQLLLISYLYRKIGLSHQLAQLVTVGCVSTLLFICFKYCVYPQRNDRGGVRDSVQQALPHR
jgi:putative flippase GtrA